MNDRDISAICKGQRWEIPVLHLAGRVFVHVVLVVRPGWIDVKPEEDVNGYCAVPRRQLEQCRQAPSLPRTSRV